MRFIRKRKQLKHQSESIRQATMFNTRKGVYVSYVPAEKAG